MWLTDKSSCRARMTIPSSSRQLVSIVKQHQSHVTESSILKFYIPIYHWIMTQLKTNHQCTFIGIQCPQGGGKTTMVTALEHMLEYSGKKCISLSLDDLYLTNEEQKIIAQKHHGNRLLQVRLVLLRDV